MLSDTTGLKAYLLKLGLLPEIADIYLALQAYGPQTISALARHSGVERTRIYRMLEELKRSSLVEIETRYKRNVFKAAPISNLQMILTEKEHQLERLRSEFDSLASKLSRDSLSSPLTHVQFYQGEEGNKQMFWNQTRAQTETLAVLYENMQHRTHAAYFERWVRRCNEREMKFRGIIGQHFVDTQQTWYANRSNERIKNWHSRFVPHNVFPITHSTVTYDDVVTYYNWKDGEVFGIEIYNSEIAQAQRQFFEILWGQGHEISVKLGDKEAMP